MSTKPTRGSQPCLSSTCEQAHICSRRLSPNQTNLTKTTRQAQQRRSHRTWGRVVCCGLFGLGQPQQHNKPHFLKSYGSDNEFDCTHQKEALITMGTITPGLHSSLVVTEHNFMIFMLLVWAWSWWYSSEWINKKSFFLSSWATAMPWGGGELCEDLRLPEDNQPAPKLPTLAGMMQAVTVIVLVLAHPCSNLPMASIARQDWGIFSQLPTIYPFDTISFTIWGNKIATCQARAKWQHLHSSRCYRL